MASVLLTWAANNSENSSAQQVQFKESTTSAWTIATTLLATDTQAYIDNLTVSKTYDFRIVNICGGVEYPSDVKSLTINDGASTGGQIVNFIKVYSSEVRSRITFLATNKVKSTITINFSYATTANPTVMVNAVAIIPLDNDYLDYNIPSGEFPKDGTPIITAVSPESDLTYQYTF